MENILLALAVVAGIGLIAGILLALSSHFFAVKEDETTLKVRECLPGVNCGACGYTGCDDYAKAITNDGAKTNLCIPGGDSCAANIANILGIEAEDTKEAVAFVHCNGNLQATRKKALYEGINTCRAASMIYAGPEECRFGCLGMGDCLDACPTNAICIQDGVARVDSRLCIGCGMCARTCPKGIITIVPLVARTVVMCSSRDKGAVAKKACDNACIGCKKCEKSCPSEAIKVIDNLAVIDYDKCNYCSLCAEVCPTHCIKNVRFEQHQVF